MVLLGYSTNHRLCQAQVYYFRPMMLLLLVLCHCASSCAQLSRFIVLFLGFVKLLTKICDNFSLYLYANILKSHEYARLAQFGRALDS